MNGILYQLPMMPQAQMRIDPRVLEILRRRINSTPIQNRNPGGVVPPHLIGVRG